MSSGRVLLSVRGREDMPISGKPQYSYYLKNYARSEPYEHLFVDNALATIVQGRTPTYGDTIAFEIPRRGDLLSKMFLKIVLPPSYLYSNLIRTKTDTFNLYSIIEFVDLEIGGQLVQRLTGEYILNYINLYYSSNDIDFFQNVTEMKIKDLRKLYSQFGQFVLLPIPFYFWDNKGNELPLISLTRQHIKVNLKLAPKPPITGLPELTDVTISTEYILLGSEATKKVFINNGLVYRISQVQMNSAVISNSETKKVLDLNFQNAVREMFVCIQPRTYQDISNSKFYNYFGNYRNSFLNFRNPETGWYLSEHHISGMSLRFNNNEYINDESSGSAQMLSSVLPQKYYANSDNIQQFRGYVYPFVIDPLARNPQGHINMSRILKKQLTLYMNTSQLSRSVRVYASSYNIMMIRDGVSGLMFTNPSHYNPKIVLGESSDVVEGVPPTDLETLSPDQGFYYAIKIDDGHEIVGIQFHTEEEPQFGGDLELHDDQFSYLLNTNDTFMSNVTPTDTSEYTPGTVSQLLQNVIEVPNEQDASRADRYHITTSNNYIYTSNFGFVKNIRLAIKVHESEGSLGTGALTSYGGQYSNLLTDATFTVYKSSKFFTADDIDTWIADPATVSEIRNVRAQNTYESPGYYYSALATINASGDITDYTKVHFARTYDFSFSFSVLAPTTDEYSIDTNISTVSFKVSNLSGSGSVKVFLGSAVRVSETFYNEGDTELDISFEEELERGLKTYSVLISPDGSRNLTKNFQVIAGGTAPPLYRAIQLLPPDGYTQNQFIISLQGFSPTPDYSLFGSLQIEGTGDKLSNTNTFHTTSLNLTQNVFSNIVVQGAVFDTDGSFLPDDDRTTITDVSETNEHIKMGENDFFYTTSKVSVSFYTVGVSYTTPPTGLEKIITYGSESPFDVNDVTGWKNNAIKREFTLSDLTASGQSTYYRLYEKRVNRPERVTFYKSNIYYVPFDTSVPVMTITYAGELKVDGQVIEIERFTPISELVNYSTDYTYINVQIDDDTAIIEETNNIVNSVAGDYSISFTATDPFLNTSTQSFTVRVIDEEPPEVVSSTFTGAGLGHTLDVTFNEECSNIDLRENGILKVIYNDMTSFSYVASGLTEGVLYTYTADVKDVFENTGTVSLGSYTADSTEPELFLYNYSDVRIFDGTTVYIERYVPFVEIDKTAVDNIDGTVAVTAAGSTPDVTERDGIQTVRTYTATDSAGNSNTATITFEINDTVTPYLLSLSTSLDEATGTVTISGQASEECNVFIYSDSSRTVLVGDAPSGASNIFSNTFVETGEGMFKYYLSVYDGVNYNNTRATKEIYVSDSVFKFSYEGISNTSVSVPAGKTNMYVFLWGANGGRNGGSGGFTQSSISGITSGQTVTVSVGKGGDSSTNIFGGGGVRAPGASVVSNTGGGGMSNVVYNGYIAAVAGGGGGGTSRAGGGGGGLVGLDASPGTGGGGTGGTQTSGGTGGVGDPGSTERTYTAEDGIFLKGGDSNVSAVSLIHSGGGGGGGYFGGGGGVATTRTSDNYGRGGGGGSGWLGLDGATVLSDPSNEWGSSTTFEDTGGRTWTAAGLTYTNSKILRGTTDSSTKAASDHFFYDGSVGGNGYVVIMFT